MITVSLDAKDLDTLHMMADMTMRHSGMEGGPAAFLLMTKVRQAQLAQSKPQQAPDQPGREA